MRALVARSQNEVGFEEISELPSNDVLVDVAYSSLNYKDGLAVTGRGRIIRKFPMIVGIDLAGTVVQSASDQFKVGDRVIGHGNGLGELDWGGYAPQQRVRAGAIVKLPDGLSLEESMRLGTAGFTAMLCVLMLEQNEVRPSEREIVVTGAGGGVGSIAVHLLAQLGYKVAAATGRTELHDYLRELGATSVVSREELIGKGPLQSERWGGGIDTVGGELLANIYAQTAYDGAIACCGMAQSHELNTTVWPLILRNVSLLGASSMHTPMPRRLTAWKRLASDIDHDKLAMMSRTEPLSKIFELSEEILAGKVRGRIVIDVNA